MSQNQLCFVWGPPLCGQRRWVAKSIAESPHTATNRLFTIEDYDDESDFRESLNLLSSTLEKIPSHSNERLYCTLPWKATDHGLELEQWIAEQKIFTQSPASTPIWEISFTGLCPFNAERLPSLYRKGLEEFSRSSYSDIIVVSPEVEMNPEWLGTDILDFGRYIEIYEEVLWNEEILRLPLRPTFAESVDFESVVFPLKSQESRFVPLIQELMSGLFGKIWNAEITWKESNGNLRFLSTQNGSLYSWSSKHQDFLNLVPDNCAVLEICGQNLNAVELLKLQDPRSFN